LIQLVGVAPKGATVADASKQSDNACVRRTWTIWKGARLGGLPMLWVVTAILMVRDYVHDPYDPSRQGTSAYGHNHQGALLHGLGLTLIELGVVYMALRPWSYHRSWARSAGALVICLPWTAFSMFMTMHAGGVIALHFFWLTSIVLILAICALWSGVAAMQNRHATEARAC
jgi:hypothetical protein